MILKLPAKFDENEWWVLIGLIIVFIIFVLVKKHFPAALTFLLLLFTANLAMTIDFIFAPSFSYNFYDAMDKSGYNLFDFILTNFNYSLFAYLFIAFYDKYQFKGIQRILYILGWILTSLLLEVISIKLNVYKYVHWNIGFSTICYVLIFPIYIFLLKVSKFSFRHYLQVK